MGSENNIWTNFEKVMSREYYCTNGHEWNVITATTSNENTEDILLDNAIICHECTELGVSSDVSQGVGTVTISPNLLFRGDRKLVYDIEKVVEKWLLERFLHHGSNHPIRFVMENDGVLLSIEEEA
jgi:hypothetical protein